MRQLLMIAVAAALLPAPARAETLDEALIAVHKPYYAQRAACDQLLPVSGFGGQDAFLRIMAEQKRCNAAAEAEHDAAVQAVRARLKAECAARGPLKVGMSATQVDASCQGLFTRRHVTTTVLAGVRDEQWTYDHAYLYFRAGILTAVQHID